MEIHVAPHVPPFIRLAHHPVRWRILTELAQGDQRVRELVERVGHPQNLLSYHLRLLREGGLVVGRRSSHDGRDTYYHLDLDRCAEGLDSAGGTLHPALGAAPASRRHPTAVPRVLFVCTGNSARSPIAEALLRHRTGGRVVVASAGISPKPEIHSRAVRVLRDRFDIDIHDQVPRAVDDVPWLHHAAASDRIVTLCDRAREHLSVRGGQRTHWSIPDPAEAPGPARYASFVSAATDIDTRVLHLMHTLDSWR